MTGTLKAEAGLAARLAVRLEAVRERMAQAARAAGRDPATVRLVAVTKTHPAAWVAAAAQVGQTTFGENRVEEALPKMAVLAGLGTLHWHMIGHIQSRKARDAARAGFALVHSVDSLKLAERLSHAAVEAGRRQPALLECNISGEATKSGFAAWAPAERDALLPIVERIAALPGLEIRGLMTMAPIVAAPDDARPYFQRLRALRDRLMVLVPGPCWAELSMGMTDDFEAAIAEGATLVRVGRAIFGERA
ncbi:MAG: YggS family pyridoxal phosphate-dependent enzyme [Anaerolineales bacterium]|nr:YggS family pyridoxal phosphate-dependent enzyme [Anaerolineales bacterium]